MVGLVTAFAVLGADFATAVYGGEDGGHAGAGLVGIDDRDVMEGDGFRVAVVTRVLWESVCADVGLVEVVGNKFGNSVINGEGITEVVSARVSAAVVRPVFASIEVGVDFATGVDGVEVVVEMEAVLETDDREVMEKGVDGVADVMKII